MSRPRWPESHNSLSEILGTVQNRVPTGSIKAIFKHLADTSPELYEEAIKRGLRAREAKSCALIALAGAYIDGKPVERVQMETTTRMLFVPGGSTPDLGSEDE